jgi:hypothetical protein
MHYNLTSDVYLIFLKNEIKFHNVKYPDKTCIEDNSLDSLDLEQDRKVTFLKLCVFWNVKICRPVSSYRRLIIITILRNVGNYYQSTRRHIPEQFNM